MTRHRSLDPMPDPSAAAADSISQTTEARMRRALGLDGKSGPARQTAPRTGDSSPPARHRHRFVSDGEVPVVVMPSRMDQPAGGRAEAAAAAALQTERDARQQTERALTAAQAAIRDLQGKVAQLQTTLAHVTLARDEAVAALQQSQEQLAAQVPPPAEPPIVRRRGRPPKIRAETPGATPGTGSAKPVKWWVKGWRSALAD